MSKLFEPITIKNVTIRNRTVVSAMVTELCKPDGMASEEFIAYHEAKAKGGWGLIVPENYVIAPGVGGFANLPGLFDDAQIASHKAFTDRIHAAGAKIVCQLYHAGRRISPAVTGREPVGPSAMKFASAPWEISRALTVPEIEEIVEQFADCAVRAKKAGFDGVEIHGGHGYLLHSFNSPFSNKRCDAYGGSIAGRAKLSVDIVKRVREKVGDDFLIQYRISCEEGVPGAITIEEAKAIAILLEEAGVDLLHVSQGGDFNHVVSPSSCEPKARYIDNAAEMKKVLHIPVIGVGRINDPLIAEEVLRSGKADLVTMARASLADPEFPNKAEAGRYQDINYCIGCLQGCTKGCLVNPLIGHESEYDLSTVRAPKTVYIAGGGIAGCEAAIVAAKRGHQVTVFECSDQLGGQWRLACVPPGKTDFSSLVAWQRVQMQQLGVDVRLQTALTRAIVEAEKPDLVLVATGSKPAVPPIPGAQQEHVVLASEILAGKVNAGANVVVIGGGSVGAETADHLALHGSKVAIVEMRSGIAEDASARPRKFLLERLEAAKAAIYTDAKVLMIGKDAVYIEQNGQPLKLGQVDTVVIATGSRSYAPLLQELQDCSCDVVAIGDASHVKDGKHNMHEAFQAALQI
ncbi:MAG: FAD-dependent oxidoreductase [Peptococcaceae bacterium]